MAALGYRGNPFWGDGENWNRMEMGWDGKVVMRGAEMAGDGNIVTFCYIGSIGLVSARCFTDGHVINRSDEGGANSP